MNGSISARKLRSVLALAESAGVSRESLLTEAGLRDRDLADPERRLPLRVWGAVWRHIVARTGDEAIGLRAAQRVDRGYFGVIDYVVRSSDTMGDAVVAAARLFRLANTGGSIDVERVGPLTRIVRRIEGDESLALPRQITEFALAAMVNTFRLASAEPWSLHHVELRHPAPDDAAEHERAFGCTVVFGAPRDALYVDTRVLALPMRDPDPTLRSLIESHARALLRELPGGDDAVSATRRLIIEELPDGDISAAHIAARMGKSTRTLHRELSARGVNFRALCNQARCEIAKGYLRSGRMAIGEVAFLLGYSETSSFHRAFKAWTGATPRAFQRAAAAGDPRRDGEN